MSTVHSCSLLSPKAHSKTKWSLLPVKLVEDKWLLAGNCPSSFRLNLINPRLSAHQTAESEKLAAGIKYKNLLIAQ
jgi:hypothetical protein